GLGHNGTEPCNVVFIQRNLSTSCLSPAITVPVQCVPCVVALKHQREAVHPAVSDLRDPGAVPDSTEVKRLHPIGDGRHLSEELLDAPSRFGVPPLAGSTAAVSVRRSGRVRMMPKEQLAAVVRGAEPSILPPGDCHGINPVLPAGSTR
ncbi:MAG: hypothetical protein ACREF3_02935, partial [Acetobacteraceae bacterium]